MARGAGPQRAAVIDLGSNTAKMSCYEARPGGGYARYREEGARARLGDGLERTGRLSEASMGRALAALARFRERAALESISHVVPVATSAAREASNGAEFLGRARALTGLAFAALSGRDEALLSYVGAARSLALPTAVYFDIGGGSMEVVRAEGFGVRRAMSLPLGALRLTQEFAGGPGGSYTRAGAAALRRRAAGLAPGRAELGGPAAPVLVGSGGTVRAMARLHQAATGYPLAKVHNYEMGAGAVRVMSERLLAGRPSRVSKAGPVSPGRAETLAAGACAVRALVDALGARGLVVSAQALREGALAASLGPRGRLAGGRAGEVQAARLARAARRPGHAPPRLGGLAGLLDGACGPGGGFWRVLDEAARMQAAAPPVGSPGGMLHALMGEDSALGHGEQLAAAMAVAAHRTGGAGAAAAGRLGALLPPGAKKAARRAAALLALSEVLEGSGARMAARPAPGGVALRVRPAGPFPEALFREAAGRAAAAFGVGIECRIAGRGARDGARPEWPGPAID